MLAMFRARRGAFPHAVAADGAPPLGSQTFVPLGGVRFVIVVAPAGAPPICRCAGRLRHRRLPGRGAAPGTWHHALARGRRGDFVVHRTRRGSRRLRPAELQPPVSCSACMPLDA